MASGMVSKATSPLTCGVVAADAIVSAFCIFRMYAVSLPLFSALLVYSSLPHEDRSESPGSAAAVTREAQGGGVSQDKAR